MRGTLGFGAALDSGRLWNEMIATDNQHAILKYGKQHDEVENGSFGAIDLDGVKGGGANDYTSWLAYGYQTKLTSARCCPWSLQYDRPHLFPVRKTLQRCTHYPSNGGSRRALPRRLPRVMKVPVIVYTVSSINTCGWWGCRFAGNYTNLRSLGCVSGSY